MVSSFIKLLFQLRRRTAQTCNDLLPNQYIDQVIHGVVDGDSVIPSHLRDHLQKSQFIRKQDVDF